MLQAVAGDAGWPGIPAPQLRVTLAPLLIGVASACSIPLIKEKAALYAAYMPFLKNGGMFVPTQKPYKLGDEIYLILALMDDPNKYPIAGKVAWITPPGAHNNKAQGIGVHFPDDESGQRARLRIEEILGAALRSSRATHTL